MICTIQTVVRAGSLLSGSYSSEIAAGIPIQMMSIAIFVLYALMCHFQSGALGTLMREIKSTTESLGETGNRDYVMLGVSTGIIGVLSLAVFLTKTLSLYHAESIAALLPKWFLPLVCLAVSGVIIMVILYQRAVLYAAGSITLSGRFVHMLLHLKKIHFTLLAIVVSPTLLLYSSMHGISDTVFMYVSGIEAILIMCLFLYKSCILFVGQKISILYWFLYLCIVELFPISLIVSILLRII